MALLASLTAAGGCAEPTAAKETGVATSAGLSTGAASDDPVVDDDAEILDVGPESWPDPESADHPPPAVRGGTMTASRDGAFMFVGDEFRDAVHVVDVGAEELLGSIERPGCHPGRVLEASDGTIAFTCTRSGEVVFADPQALEVLGAAEVCANPRGLALDGDTAWVACAEGQVFEVLDGQVTALLEVGEELRDVVDVGPPLRVSTFRDAAVLTIGDEGEVVERETPGLVTVVGNRDTVPFDAEAELPADGVGPLVPNVARRAFRVDEQVWMLHQSARTGEAGVSQTLGWSGAQDGGCVGSQNAGLSWAGPNAGEFASEVFPSMGVAFDVAVDPERERFAVAGASESEWVVVIREASDLAFTVLPSCSVFGEQRVDSMVTAVAFAPDGRVWGFSPEANVIWVLEPEGGAWPGFIRLGGGSIEDSGFQLFHRPTSRGIGCVSCHPEGREDGLRWRLEPGVARRTLSLAGRLDGGAPFHWGGEQPDIASIDESVRVGAMGGSEYGPAYVEVFERYLFSLRAMESARDQDPDVVAEGEQAFTDLGCDTCHRPPLYDYPSNIELYGHGELQVPSLLGVRYGAPYMHDGRAEDLEAAVTDMLTHSPAQVDVTPQRRAALLAFLRTL